MRPAIWNQHCVKCWIWFFLSKNSEFPFWDSIMLSLLILTFFQFDIFQISLLLFLPSVQVLSHVWLFVTPWTAACQASLSITSSQSLLKLKSIELVIPPNHLILCRPLLLMPSIYLLIHFTHMAFSLKLCVFLCISFHLCF